MRSFGITVLTVLSVFTPTTSRYPTIQISAIPHTRPMRAWIFWSTSGARSTATLRHHDSVIGTLREAGFTVEMAAHAFSVIDSYLYGFAQQPQNLTYDTSQEAAEVAENVLRQIPQSSTRIWPS